MKVEKLAAIAEIVAAIAILVTLGYLAIQTSQNTAAINSSARQASLDAELNVLFEFSDSVAAFQTVRDNGLEVAEEQMPIEVGELGLKFIALLRLRQNQWLQYQNGLFTQEEWDAFRNSTSWLWRNPRLRRVWGRESDNLLAGFVQDTNEWLERLDAEN